MTEEKRAYHRIFYDADCVLSCGKKSWPCRIVDLSLKGCLLRTEAPIKENPEKLYQLRWNLSDDLDITMALSIVHTVDNTTGFKCEHIDIESITELRRLVELNLGDSALLERDLLALAEGH
ncbi:MAG: PilZ domain-containing protein [Gammaproteobacteria bacterium]